MNTNPNPFEKTLREYIQSYPSTIHIKILTPCYGGVCHSSYTHCLIQTILLLQQFSIRVTYEFCVNDSLITRARNNLLAKTMSDKTVTHLLFIDSDISWSPMDIAKLLIHDKAIIGGIYPLKKYQFNETAFDDGWKRNTLERKYAGPLQTCIGDTAYLKHNMVKYNVNIIPDERGKVCIKNNAIPVKHLATGFMLIKRETITAMHKSFPSTKYCDDVGYLLECENENAFALFDCGVVDGRYLSEDWMFCRRWAEMGGKIWADITISLTHTGTEEYTGLFMATII